MARFILILALALYALSLALPGYFATERVSGEIEAADCAGSDDPKSCLAEKSATDARDAKASIPTYGFQILLTGWLGILSGIAAWYPNPLLFASLKCCRTKRYRAATVLIALAFALGLQPFFITGIPKDEGLVIEDHLDYMGLGYYLWLSAILAIAIYIYLQRKAHGVSDVSGGSGMSKSPG